MWANQYFKRTYRVPESQLSFTHAAEARGKDVTVREKNGPHGSGTLVCLLLLLWSTFQRSTRLRLNYQLVSISTKGQCQLQKWSHKSILWQGSFSYLVKLFLVIPDFDLGIKLHDVLFHHPNWCSHFQISHCKSLFDIIYSYLSTLG